MSDPKAEQLTEATPTVNVGGGKTGWDWIMSNHPILLRILIVALIGILAFVAWKTSPVIFAILTVSGIVSVVVGYLLFRNQFFFNDSVVLLAFGAEDLTQLSIYLIGKEKFRTLSHSGNVLSFSSESGDPVYIADSFDGEHVRYPWSFETSRIKFVLKADTFDYVKDIAESSLRDLNRIRSIPQILGIQEARDMILIHDDYLQKILKGDDSLQSDIDEAISQVLSEEGL